MTMNLVQCVRVVVIISILAGLLGCGIPLPVVDENVEVSERQYKWWALEVESGWEIKVDVLHISGPPVKVYFLDKKNFTAFEQNELWRYRTGLSHMEVDTRFDSGWRRHNAPGVYYLLIRAHDWKTGASESSRAKVEISKRMPLEK
jgi:hypothetical protein